MDDKQKVEFSSTHSVDGLFLKNILTTAFEGGISYWAEARNVKRSTHYTIQSCELRDWRERGHTGEIDWTVVDAASIAEGIDRLLTKKVAVRSDILACINQAISDNDAGHIDADASDVIVQAFLFNDIVFG